MTPHNQADPRLSDSDSAGQMGGVEDFFREYGRRHGKAWH